MGSSEKLKSGLANTVLQGSVPASAVTIHCRKTTGECRNCLEVVDAAVTIQRHCPSCPVRQLRFLRLVHRQGHDDPLLKCAEMLPLVVSPSRRSVGSAKVSKELKKQGLPVVRPFIVEVNISETVAFARVAWRKRVQ